MALRTPPVPIAAPGPNLRLVAGRGMTPAARRDEQRIESAVRDTEVAEFVEDVRPLIRRAEVFAYEIGPAAYQTVRGIAAAVDRLAVRWGREPDAA